MKRLASFLVLVVVLLSFGLLHTAAQQPPSQTPLSLMYYGLLLLNRDAEAHKELQLSDEQSKKIGEYGALRARITQARGNDKERAEALKAIDKALTETLKPDQIKRLKQVVLQDLENRRAGFGGTSVLAKLPEVVEKLKLTADQQKKLNARVPLADVLTDAQKAKWQEMVGEKYEGLRVAISLLVEPPTNLVYADEKSVQEELKVTAAQQQQIVELRRKWEATVRPLIRQGSNAVRQKAEELTRSTNEAVLKVLEPAQARRLRQIALRQATNGGHEQTVLTRPEVVAELKLTEGQQAKLKSVSEERRKQLPPLFLTGENAETIAQKVAAYKKETSEQLHKVLHAGQQARLKEMIGEPFQGDPILAPRGYFRLPRPMLYLSTTGLRYAESKVLQEELKPSEVQVKQLIELGEKSRARTLAITGDPRRTDEEREKLRQEQARENDKALAALLEPPQLLRFQQLILQRYAGRQSQEIPFVEVTERLQLTREQKEQLENYEEVAKVLDERQQAKWKELLGQPFEKVNDLTRGELGFGSSPPTNVVFQYLEEKSIQKELQLTEAQIEKLPELRKTWAELTTGRDRWRGAEYARKMAAAKDALQKAVAGVLDARQRNRLHQLELQQTRTHGLDALLAMPVVRKELELSQDQLTMLASIKEEDLKTRRLITQELRTVSGPPGEEDSPTTFDLTRTRESFGKIVEKKLDAVLTADQHARLKAMLGEPFKGRFPLIRPTGPGQRGGRGNAGSPVVPPS